MPSRVVLRILLSVLPWICRLNSVKPGSEAEKIKVTLQIWKTISSLTYPIIPVFKLFQNPAILLIHKI